MIAQRLYRGGALIVLRGARLLHHHLPTLFSAAIIATLGVAAVTSDAFRSSGRPRELPPILRVVPDGKDIGLQAAQSIIWSPPEAELGLRSVVYFIYESELQREVIEGGLRDLSRARFRLSGPEDTNFFIRAATPQEAALAEQEISRAAELAELQGYAFQVVDLRQDRAQ